MSKLTDLLPIPRNKINQGLASAGNSFMLATLGNPRSSYSSDCQTVTNPTLKKRIITKSVGPFRVSGLDSAVESLVEIMAHVKADHPDVYAALGTAGMLCPRLVRGSRTSISNHSWGTAVDLTIGGQLVPLGKPAVQRGLLLVAPIFNKAGWFWGAGWSRADSMHMEASRSLITKWAGGVSKKVVGAVEVLQMGDRGTDVTALQKALNKLGEKLDTDGIFGADTRRAVIAFQGKSKLRADGIVGKDTQSMLLA
jgi:hypothetical protein